MLILDIDDTLVPRGAESRRKMRQRFKKRVRQACM